MESPGGASGFYGPELAQVHDAGFGDFARLAADGILAALADAELEDGLVVDLGCGTGILAERLLAAGFGVLGVDLSEPALAIARKRAPGAEFVRGSALDFEPPRCVAIAAVGEVLGYAADARAATIPLRDVFARFRRALVPGGILAFDLAGPDRDPEPRRAWREGAGWLVCTEAEQTQPGRELRRRIVVFREGATSWARADEEHRLFLHPPDEVLAALAGAGFAASVADGYTPDAEPIPGLGVFFARSES